jgi:hypothetical protein
VTIDSQGKPDEYLTSPHAPRRRRLGGEALSPRTGVRLDRDDPDFAWFAVTAVELNTSASIDDEPVSKNATNFAIASARS